jgi:hypothetical protein
MTTQPRYIGQPQILEVSLQARHPELHRAIVDYVTSFASAAIYSAAISEFEAANEALDTALDTGVGVEAATDRESDSIEAAAAARDAFHHDVCDVPTLQSEWGNEWNWQVFVGNELVAGAMSSEAYNEQFSGQVGYPNRGVPTARFPLTIHTV